MQFEIFHTSKKSKARVGRIHTAHGIIDTPGFVAVGTNGTLKALDNKTVHEIGLQLMFCNTYHLMVQPGSALIREAGGIHRFINRSLPIITDSGGFQVFSLAYGSVADELKGKGKKQAANSVLKISEDGVLFRSYRDGKKILLTPESSVEAQKDFGSDIIIPLDELPPFHIGEKELLDSFERTHRWEKRSLDFHLRNPANQAMYAVIHGGLNQELRKRSSQILRDLPFDGFAIGGSMGKTKEQMFTMLADCVNHIPLDRPKHLLGIGDITSLDACVPLGIDTFDSAYPTKAARHGMILTKEGPLKLSSTKHAKTFGPIEPTCRCPTCSHYSLSYLHHLHKASEVTAHTLATIHNLHYMVDKMSDYREKILRDEI
jgi:queuine tRNA-ribosyltransferase